MDTSKNGDRAAKHLDEFLEVPLYSKNIRFVQIP